MRYIDKSTIVLLLAAAVASGCATTGATLNSGVGDSFHEHAPYYAGRVAPSDKVGHLPIAYQRGASQAPLFDPKLSEPMQSLLNQMNGFLESLNVSTRLVDGGSVSAVVSKDTRFPPDVRFGCVTENGAPDGDCAISGDSALGRKGMRMKLAVGRPAADWIQWAQQVMTDRGAEQTLVITLEVGQYLVRQRGIVGKKELELGTGYVQNLPWLTSLETPVSVLQLTGALVGPDGKAIRIGAEGLYAHRTNLLTSAIGGQALISDDDVKKLGNARRDDLPGKPLVWQVSLRNLVAQLTSKPMGNSSF